MDGTLKIEDTNCVFLLGIVPTAEGYRATVQVDNGEVVMRRTAEWYGDTKLSGVVNRCVNLAVGCCLEAQSSLR